MEQGRTHRVRPTEAQSTHDSICEAMEQGRTHRVRPTEAQRKKHTGFYYSFFISLFVFFVPPYWVGISPSTLRQAQHDASLSATLRSTDTAWRERPFVYFVTSLNGLSSNKTLLHFPLSSIFPSDPRQ